MSRHARFVWALALACGSHGSWAHAETPFEEEPNRPRAYAPSRDEAERAKGVYEDEGGSLSPISRGITRLWLGLGSGSRPSPFGSPDYSTKNVLLEYKSSISFLEPNDLGTALAFEWGLGIGWASESPKVAGEGIGLLGKTSLGVAGRLLTIDKPLRASLLLHAGMEFELGGQRWWSSMARFAPLAGPRLLFRWSERWTGDVEYAFVPDSWHGKPDGYAINRYEHRLTGSLAYGPIGLGARYQLAAERLYQGEPLRSHGHTVLLLLDFRYDWLGHLILGDD